MRAAGAALAAVLTLSAANVEWVAGGGDSPAGAAARQVKLVEPFAVAFDPRGGDWFVCEHKGERIVRVTHGGATALLAGSGEAGYAGDGGPAGAAAFRDPHGVVITRTRQMYVADTLNHVIRRIDLASGLLSTFAGDGQPGFAGDGGPAVAGRFHGTFALALNRAEDQLYVADLFNRRIRKIDLRSGVVTTVAGNGSKGTPTDGAPAAASPLVDPRAVAVDSRGQVFILERGGNALRVVDPAGAIRTVIAPGQITPDLNGPKHVCIDRWDRVLIADAENHLVRLYDPRTQRTVTVAGAGRKGERIDPRDPTRTELNRPHGVAVDARGRLWISDSYNHRILRIRRYRPR